MGSYGGMSEKLSYKFVENSYPQARIEAAFAQVFNVPLERIKFMRGRIKHLMAIGLPETRPGKGARVLYGSDMILRWLLVLILEDCSVAPVGAVKAVKVLWDFYSVDRWVEMALDAGSESNPVYLTMRPNFAKLAWDEYAPPEWIKLCRRWDTRAYPKKTIEKMAAKWGPGGERHFRDNLRSFHDSVEADGSWGCTRNLSRDLKLVRDCLEPQRAGAAAGKPDTHLGEIYRRPKAQLKAKS
jgi:hypothetical protein